MIGYLIFVLVVAVLLGLGHRYLWRRFVRDAAMPTPWGRATTALLAVLFAVLVVTIASTFLLDQSLPRRVAASYSWVGYAWLGTFFFLLLFLALSDVVRTGFVRVRGPIEPERRTALVRMFVGAAAVLGIGTSAVGIAGVASALSVKRLRIVIERLGASMSGVRIAQISDLHVGPLIGKSYVEQVVAKVNALEPDVIVITGDLVDGPVRELAEHVAPLAKLEARHGVFFVTGNHEYYQDVDAWLAHLPTLGIKLLKNERVRIGGDDGFDLAGVDDRTAAGPGHEANLKKALGGRDENRACVLLAHQPRGIELANEMGVDLQLSGHTHGGQIFPWSLLVGLSQPFLAGLHRLSKAQIYVSSGTGYWGPPMRVGTTAEITSLELVKSA